MSQFKKITKSQMPTMRAWVHMRMEPATLKTTSLRQRDRSCSMKKAMMSNWGWMKQRAVAMAHQNWWQPSMGTMEKPGWMACQMVQNIERGCWKEHWKERQVGDRGCQCRWCCRVKWRQTWTQQVMYVFPSYWHWPPPAANIGVPVSPVVDSTTTHPLETEDAGVFLQGVQTSSFSWKWKLCNMLKNSACFCGRSAVLSMHNKMANVICCRVAGCKTKWVHTTFWTQVYWFKLYQYHLGCVGLTSSPKAWTCKAWTCKVCLSNTGRLRWKHVWGLVLPML